MKQTNGLSLYMACALVTLSVAGCLSTGNGAQSVQSPFTSTGSMVAARYAHTSTTLQNGLVLVAGGTTGSAGAPTVLSSAELYNKATGAWTRTGSMITARSGHAAVLLQNGQVLVVAGVAPGAQLLSSELYDPVTGIWSTSGSLPSQMASSNGTLTLLADGTVLMAGGGTANSSAARYDPLAGVWTMTGSLNTGRSNHSATLLTDGTVLVAGGINGTNLASCELYTPTLGTWTPTLNTMLSARSNHSAVLLPNGTVFVAGGSTTNSEYYNPSTQTWTAAAGSSNANGQAVLLVSGSVLFGSYSGTDLYNTSTGAWTSWAASSVSIAPYPSAAVSGLQNGHVLYSGGTDANGNAVANAELY